jgi:hypothetical protein
MGQITVEWALWSERQDARKDYGVLACSDERLGPAQFEKIITRFSPGTPDAPHALPRVTISWVGTDTSPHVGIAIQTRSTTRDGVGREIYPTSYFCIPYQQLQQQPVTYLGLYQALREIQLPDTGTGSPLNVTVPPLDTRAIAHDLENLGAATVRTATALLLHRQRHVCLTQAEQTTLEDRLRFIDAVAALLPYGYRTKFTATTWANSATRHRLRISFTHHPNRDTTPIPWHGTAPIPHDHNLELDHHDLVQKMLTRHDPAEIIERLAQDTQPRTFDEPQHAVWTLQKISETLRTSEGITSGTIGLPELRTQFDVDGRGIGNLAPQQRYEALRKLIELGSGEDIDRIVRWLPEAVGESTELAHALLGGLANLARESLWSPNNVRIQRSLDLAIGYGFGDPFLSEVIARPDDTKDLEGGLEAAAELIAQNLVIHDRLPDRAMTERVLRDNIPVVCETIARLSSGNRMEQSEALSFGTRLLSARLARPFKAALFEDPLPVGAGEIDALAAESRGCVRALLQAASDTGHLPMVAHGFVDWLILQGGKFPAGHDGYWEQRLAALTPADSAMQGWFDVLQLVVGGRPTGMPYHQESWTSYQAGFVYLWKLQWADSARMIRGLAEYLAAMPWQDYPGRADQILGLVADGLTPHLAEDERPHLADALLKGFEAAGDLPLDPRARQWLHGSFTHPAADGPQYQDPADAQDHGGTSPDRPDIENWLEWPAASPTPAIRALQFLLRMHERKNMKFPDALRELRDLHYIDSGDTAAEVVRNLNHNLQNVGASPKVGDSRTKDLIRLLISGYFGEQTGEDFRKRALQIYAHELRYSAALIRVIAGPSDADHKIRLEGSTRKLLEGSRNDLTEVVAPQESGRGGLWNR